MNRPKFSPILLIYAMTFMAGVSGNMLGSVISIYARDYVSATIEEVGLIISVFSMTSIPSKVLAGFLGSGKRILYISVVGMLISTFCPLGMALLQTPLMLITFRAIQGFGSAMVWPSMLTLVGLLAKGSRRNQQISNYSFVVSVGMFAAPSIGSVGIALIGMRNTFFLSAIVSVVSVFAGMGLIYLRKSLFEDVEDEKGDKVQGAVSSILRNRAFLNALMVLVSQSFAYGTILAYGTLYVKDAYQVSDSEVALIFLGYNGVLMLSRLALGKILKLVSKEKCMLLCLVSLTLILPLLTLSSSYVMFVLIFSLLGISHGILFPVGAMILIENVPRNILPVANALFTTGFDIGATIGPVAAAPVVARYTNRESILVAAIVPAIVLGIEAVTGKRSRKETVTSS